MINEEKIQAAFLHDYDLASSDPKWSSWHLERCLASLLEDQQGTIADIFRGLDLALKTGDVRLTETVATFIQVVGRLAFAKYRDAYDRADWTWAERGLAGELSPARAYLLLRTLPADRTTPDVASTILRGLDGTPQFEEAAATLADELEPSVIHPERG